MPMLWSRLLAVAALLLMLPNTVFAWGTLTDLLPMTSDEESTLRFLIKWYGADRIQENLNEIVPRRGPHPTHQFIVRQAYLLLAKDPAYQDSPWQLPSIDTVLAWDGIVRRTAPVNGMWERETPGTGVAAALAPAKSMHFGGPSADAELTVFGTWNPEYVASNHYWNPWLKCGTAPEAAAACYETLITAMVTDDHFQARAKAASHLGHYLTDAICPKHADMIALDRETLETLTGYANAWFAEHDSNPTITLSDWLASEQVTDAQACIVKASGVSLDAPYWRRVNAFIWRNPLLAQNDASVRISVDVAAPSLRTSVAAFLAVLHERPPDKDLARFYGFFDPFYYNGQLVMTYEGLGRNAQSVPQFGLATPTSEHLIWETNPAVGQYVEANMHEMVLGGTVENCYLSLPDDAGRWSPDAKVRKAAYQKSMAEFVRQAALQQHGNSAVRSDDFERDFVPSLHRSIKALFSALRSCITAIRGSATYAYFPTEGKYRVYCDLTNLAEETARIKQIRVAIARDGKLCTRSSWTRTISCTVAKDGHRRVTVELPDAGITEKEPKFFVDVFGSYDKTPDLGFWRGEVSQRPPRIMHGMSLPDFDRVTGALDLAICFDVTGSMGSSIDSMRDNAIAILGKLKARLGDVRVALVSFRDVKNDKEDAFSVTPFTRDINRVVNTMKGWKAKGGGDLPEDQLQAIRLVLDMWAKTKNDPRKPTKIVVVITDATAHDPDFKGNTETSIADYAERVDPAHIYPIIVGKSADAHAKAEALARLTNGEVLTAKSGDEVAELLSAAVDKAVATHGAGGGTQIPPAGLFYGGMIAAVIGGAWMLRERRTRTRKR